MPPLTNRDIAKALTELADLIDLLAEDEQTFRVRALRRGAREIERLPEPAVELLAARRLASRPGIGEGIARRVGELAATGTLAELEEAQGRAAGLLQVSRIDGLGPTTTRHLRDKLGIRNLDDLEAAVHAGRTANFGALAGRRPEELLAAIERVRDVKKVAADKARREALPLLEAVRAVRGVVYAEYCGSLKRRRDLVGDVDIMCATDDVPAVADAFCNHRLVEVVLAKGVRCGIRTYSGLQVDVFCVGTGAVGLALHHWTGGKEHLIALRILGAKHGFKMNEEGIWTQGGAGPKLPGGDDEGQPYALLGMPYIVPELRENRGELERAMAGTLPHLVEAADLRGDVHVHGSADDGRGDLAAIAEAAAARRLEYVVVVEHSPARGGLDARGLAERTAEIRALNERLGGRPRLLAGVEVDILADGSLDLPASALAGCDYVLAAAHSHLDLPRAAQTARMVRAMESGVVDAIAHPSGRLLGVREAIDVDIEEVARSAARADVALELNVHPDRHDLGDVHAFMAREARAWIVIGTDAHSADAVGDWGTGIDGARRAWLEPKDVLNTRGAGDFLDLVRARRREAGL